MPPKLTGGPERCDSKYAGTPTGYRQHMKKRETDKSHLPCNACRKAIAVQSYNYRKRRLLNGAREVPRGVNTHNHYRLEGGLVLVDAAGTRRRLMALQRLGWSLNEIGTRLGKSTGNNFGYTLRHRQWVMPESAQKVTALYNELSGLKPPVVEHVRGGNSPSTVMTRAKRKGYLVPACWDDDTMDDPYVLPYGMDKQTLWLWFYNSASEVEKVEWALTYGIPEDPNRKKKK